jgi:hypothetical protein
MASSTQRQEVRIYLEQWATDLQDARDWPIRDKISQMASRISLALDVLLSRHVTSLAHYRAMIREPYSFYRNVFSEAVPLYGPDRLFR